MDKPKPFINEKQRTLMFSMAAYTACMSHLQGVTEALEASQECAVKVPENVLQDVTELVRLLDDWKDSFVEEIENDS